ncbi:MAG: hypothetical protein JXQ73_25210 [Phycisphaerae bacterium]|nr:hypothetical protein [Phycisphaerae bacterium]
MTLRSRTRRTGPLLSALCLTAVSSAVVGGEPSHPGNVFLAGQDVSVPVPANLSATAKRWRVLDDALAIIAEGETPSKHADTARQISLGKQGIGWYRVEFLDGAGKLLDWTSAAVLARLSAPVPDDSPVCLDVALSWYRTNGPSDREGLTHLARLAGVSWVRDRLRWREIEPAAGQFVQHTHYDMLAEMQVRAGLKVLQTFHGTPVWAASEPSATSRFPDDLRQAYHFCKAMSVRFKGRVQAWEPWNEANAGNFGGQTIDEMCAYQKAACLGFKAGDPKITVCWNPMGGVNTPALSKGVLENETWPYYEVYSIHSYDWAHDYERLWAPARAAACGRPIWVTECDRGMKAAEDSLRGDFTHDFARLKAEFMAQSYASSLHAGSSRHFHFILPQYTEGHQPIQFGLVRRDLTPRLSYVALAALGRMLAGAQCLGRWAVEGKPNAWVIAFRARPDGVERDVVVAWAEAPVDWPQRGKASIDWLLPAGAEVVGVFDYLGRPRGKRVPSQLRSAPVFVVLSKGQAETLPLTRAPGSARREGAPSPVVLQLQMPRSATIMRKEAWTPEHERTVVPGKPADLRIVAYNFGGNPVGGAVAVEHLPDGWRLTPSRWEVRLEPMQRQETVMTLETPLASGSPQDDRWIRFRGELGEAGRPSLAFRILARASDGKKAK